MPSTQVSRRTIFRTIAQTPYSEWPVYNSSPLYDQSSLDGLEADIRTVAPVWFDHDTHESVEEFVCHYPLAYVDFQPKDRCSGATRYEMSQLFRVFLLKELYGWNHETAFVEYLNHHADLGEQLGLDTVPDQSTLWRSWHKRFEADPFTGDRTGYEDGIIGTKEKTDEYTYQWATVQLVGNTVPIVLDARPVRKGESRLEIVEDPLIRLRR